MKRILTLIAGLVIFHCSWAQIKVNNIENITGKLVAITAPLKSYEALSKNLSVIDKPQIINEQKTEPISKFNGAFQNDPVVQRSVLENRTENVNILPTISQSWDGGSGGFVSPISPTIAAGPNHIVQMTNGSNGATISVWSKTGTPLLTNFRIAGVHNLPGAAGSPIVLFDKMADRWLLSEITTTAPYKLAILISQTNDPVGTYYVYSFDFGNQLPNYPKYSVWANAYYCTTNNYLNTVSYSNSSFIAFDRAKLLAGNPTASLVKVDLASSQYISMSPITFQGGVNPGSSDPGMFAYLAPDEITGTGTDSIGIISFSPNFVTPALSTFNIQSIVAAPYNYRVDPGATNDRSITQPGSTVKLESLSNHVMNQPVYRNFGTHKSIYMCHTVGLPGLIAGIRWYELRNTGSGYNMHQQGTYSPNNIHRFMPSLSVNKKGEMAIAYMVSDGVSVFPGLRIAGRKVTDPAGTLTSFEEVSIVNGNVVSLTFDRWAGAYSHMQVDPVDDVTFWFTGQYFTTPAVFGAYSRVAHIVLDIATLPVRLIDFTAAKQDAVVSIKWKTTEEINTKEFLIERSSDGVNFISIGTIAASNAPAGSMYSWVDYMPSPVNYYRLKMLDLDGKFTYSNVQRVNFDKQKSVQITPNPANSFITIRGTYTSSANTIIQLIDIHGRIIKEEKINQNSNYTIVSLNGLARGVYSIKIISNNKISAVQKVIVQ